MTTDESRLVRRPRSHPLVHLGERESASHVAMRVGERFPAYPTKEKDFVFAPPRRSERPPP